MTVYPRVCGGTSLPASFFGNSMGLSPRVRGNPNFCYAKSGNRRVYPRVCGGTPIVMFGKEFARGLSPRVRGNQ